MASPSPSQLPCHLGSRDGTVVRLPPMWPGFDSRTRRHMWVEFVVGYCPCSEGFSPCSPVFLPPQKPTFLNSNSTWKARSPFLELFGALWVNKLHLHAIMELNNWQTTCILTTNNNLQIGLISQCSTCTYPSFLENWQLDGFFCCCDIFIFTRFQSTFHRMLQSTVHQN